MGPRLCSRHARHCARASCACSASVTVSVVVLAMESYYGQSDPTGTYSHGGISYSRRPSVSGAPTVGTRDHDGDGSGDGQDMPVDCEVDVDPGCSGFSKLI